MENCAYIGIMCYLSVVNFVLSGLPFVHDQSIGSIIKLPLMCVLVIMIGTFEHCIFTPWPLSGFFLVDAL